MEHSTHPDKGRAPWRDRQIVRGTVAPFEPHVRPGGILALRLRQADGTHVEVLADAAPTQQQLVALFGDVLAAEGQQIEISISLLGNPRVRALREPNQGTKGASDPGASRTRGAAEADPAA